MQVFYRGKCLCKSKWGWDFRRQEADRTDADLGLSEGKKKIMLDGNVLHCHAVSENFDKTLGSSSQISHQSNLSGMGLPLCPIWSLAGSSLFQVQPQCKHGDEFQSVAPRNVINYNPQILRPMIHILMAISVNFFTQGISSLHNFKNQLFHGFYGPFFLKGNSEVV